MLLHKKGTILIIRYLIFSISGSKTQTPSFYYICNNNQIKWDLRLFVGILCAFIFPFVPRIQAQEQISSRAIPVQNDIIIGRTEILSTLSGVPFMAIQNLSTENFSIYNGQRFYPDSTYWLKLTLTNVSGSHTGYYLHFNSTASKIRLYQISPDGSVMSQKAGVLVPYSQRTTKSSLKDVVAFHIQRGDTTTLYLEISNALNYSNMQNYLSIVSQTEFNDHPKKSNLSSGAFLGCIGLLIVFAFILLGFSHDSLYLLYALYMLFIAGYFGSILHITEQRLFQNLPRLDLYFQWALYISQNLYILFLSHILKKEQLGKKPEYVSAILYITLPLLGILLMVSLYNYNLALIMNYFYSLMSILIAIVLFFMFYRQVRLQVRLILIGTLCMVIGALSDMVIIGPKYPGLFYSRMSFFQAGILAELILFMVAVLYSFFDEIQMKYIMEKNQLELQMEKLQKEKENILLKQEVDSKVRELATTSIKLNEKESVIVNLIKKLTELKPEQENATEIQYLIANLNLHLKNDSWNELEHYFNKVNPGFYTALHAKYPDLSANEQKICAYLKLNLSTKEIIAITGKSENTINVARSRLRKKMGMDTNENLQAVIAGI